MKRIISAFLVLVTLISCFAVVPVSAEESVKETKAPAYVQDEIYIDGNSFYCNGEKIFMAGGNTPWDNWNDFGGSFDYSFWDEHFAALHKAGINSSRVWINCNGDNAINISEKGEVTGATDKHWSDLDQFFELAEKHEIYIMATMLSFDHFKDSNSAYKKWRRMIKSKSNTISFVKNYVARFAMRYDDNPYLWSIDLCNEPDWIYENNECGNIAWKYISRYFAIAAAYIHRNSDVLVTVGMAIVKYNSDSYEGNKISDKYLNERYKSKYTYVDFYSPHYYDWQTRWFQNPFTVTPEQYKMDISKPVMIGESSAKSTKGRTLADDYIDAYNNGYCGVLPWTTNGVDANGGLAEVTKAIKEFKKAIK